jgi:hypothetical protein
MNKILRAWLPYCIVLGCLLPFINKDIHMDDANFLRLAEGAQMDAWRPHDVMINWAGTTERAFDVLSNPPGIAWLLAPVSDQPLWLMHLWMWPWMVLALWGMRRLGDQFVGNGEAAMLVLGLSPLVFLSAQGFTPDIPLLACTTAGLGGFSTRRRSSWAFALLAGCGVLFRYSGLCVLPLVILMGVLNKKWISALFCLLPLGFLMVHDVLAYGEVHWVAMGAFQSVSNTPKEVFLKGVALLAMLGGVGLMPFLAWSKRAPWALGIGGALGALGATVCALDPISSVAVVLFCASGALAFSRLGFSTKEDLVVSAWAVGGAVFLISLRFAAARYWVPFLPAFVLAALRVAPSARRVSWAIATSAVLAMGLSVDDQAFARAQRVGAEQVNRLGTPGSFSGHWGFQYHLEALGWTALEEGAATGPLHAVFLEGWPQEADPEQCRVEKGRFSVADRWWGPRTHSLNPTANLHANWLAGSPPQPSLLPWTFSNSPYVEVVLYTPCSESR